MFKKLLKFVVKKNILLVHNFSHVIKIQEPKFKNIKIYLTFL